MTRATNAGIGVTRYLQVYTVLSQALAEGDIGAGEALPSEPSLVRQYGVSRTTVRRALARLAAERCIVRRRGSGTFRPRPSRQEPQPPDRMPPSSMTRAPSPPTPPCGCCEFKHTPVPDFLHREWPEFGANVLTIRRVRYVDHEPVALVTAYVPEAIGRQLTARRLGSDTVLAALDKLGIHAPAIEQEASALRRRPPHRQAARCGVGRPDPQPERPGARCARADRRYSQLPVSAGPLRNPYCRRARKNQRGRPGMRL